MYKLDRANFKPFSSSNSLNGFLWVGDPHLSSMRIGRRKDNFMESCFSKLEFCKDWANSNNARLVLGGDLLDRKNENNIELITRLNRWCRSLNERPLDLGSNHDLTLGVALDKNALRLLMDSESLDVLLTPGLMFEDVYVSKESGQSYKVAVFGVPYGFDLPDEVISDADIVILMTHHDLAMQSSYPKSIPLKEIVGVNLVINGHMHGNKPSQRVGETLWCNPGNIEPLSIDLKDMVPRAWVFDIDHYLDYPLSPLKPLLLPHATDVFDLTGLQVSEASVVDVEQSVSDAQGSYFSKALMATADEEAEKTDDGSVLLEDLMSVTAEDEESRVASTLIFNLMKVMLPEGNFPEKLEWPEPPLESESADAQAE